MSLLYKFMGSRITIDMKKAGANVTNNGTGCLGVLEITPSGPFAPNIFGGKCCLRLNVEDRGS